MQSRFLVLFCYGSDEARKKKTTASVTFFNGFAARNWRPVLFFRWFCCEKGDGSNVVTSFYGGGDVKKGASDFIFCCWSLWFSLLKLIINNIMVVFVLRLKVIMARIRRLRKSDGGDLEVHKQNVVSSD
jgi:hypothetical protein